MRTDHKGETPPNSEEVDINRTKIPDTEDGVTHPSRALDINKTNVPDTAGDAARSMRQPAKLPPYTQAAASQRLNDKPVHPAPGIFYQGPQKREHPIGWYLRRHTKRKNLRANNERYIIADRASIRSMLTIGGTIASLFLLALIILATVISFVEATNQKYGDKLTTLEDILPKDHLKLYDSHGNLFYQAIGDGMQTSLPLNNISPNLAHAEVAIEDQNFYKNDGFDITGIVRAAIADLTSKHVVSGGSTITQQLIKNTIVGNQDTALRKLQEITLAPQVTRYYPKNRILEMYLNTTYYGEHAYGAEAAAFTYFGLQDTPKETAALQLDIAQSATLAGIPSSPIARDPVLHPKAGLARTKDVLQQMMVQGYITPQQKADALVEIQKPDFFKRGSIKNDQAPHFRNYVLRELAADFHVKLADLSRSGLVVTTTLDLNLDNQVQQIAKKHILEMSVSHNMSNAAVIVMDQHTGAIKALVGNIDPTNPKYGEFDVASQGFRQPGSSFKPFIYATAFGQGVSPGETVSDGPLTVPMCCGLPSYSPKNYDLKYHGWVTYRYALQNSFNIPAVKLLMKTGVDAALKTAQDAGISEYQGTPNYTMVLGSLSVRPVDNTQAYATFANGGVMVPKHAIAKVTDTKGNLVFKPNIQGKRVMSPAEAFMITNVLSDNDSRNFEFSKCSSLYLFSNSVSQCFAGNPGTVRPAAAKTGTSNDFRDNWTMGYTADYTVGVWAGNNDNSAMVDVTGVDGAGPIWHDTMMLVEQGHPITNFPGPPPGVSKNTVSYPGQTTTDWHMPGN